jgi:endoglucanase
VIPTDQNRSSAIPSNEQRIMISVHYYDPWDFAGDESGTITQWGAAATDASKKSTWGQEDFMDGQLKKMHDTFVTKGYPVFVGEYGSIDKTTFDSTNNTYRANFARALVTTAKKYGAATAYWDNGYNGQYGLGLFDRSAATVTQQGIINAIMSAIGGGTTTTTTTRATTTTTRATTTTTTSTTRATTTTTTRATTTTGGGTSGCSASYTVVGQWPGGFQGDVRVTAGGAGITGWTVTWTYANGQTVTQAWNASVTSSGSAVTARNVSYNGAIGAGGSTTFGFIGSWNGTNSAPSLSCAAS